MSHTPDRRQAIKIVVIGGIATSVAVAANWVKPIVESVVVPAHAQASGPIGTESSGVTD